MSEPMQNSHTKRATAADVAARAGVSRATVGYVLNRTPGQTISDETTRRVLDAAEKLGYRPHRSAQALARGASDTVLVVLPSWPSAHSFSDAVEAAAIRLAEYGLALITQVRQSNDVRPIWQSVEPLVFATFTPLADEEVRAMRDAGIRHILSIPSDLPRTMDGVRLQFEHIYSLGHRVLGYAATSDPRMQDISADRSRAFTQVAREHGANALVEVISLDDDSADCAVRRWREQGVTAAAAFNDETAAAILHALHSQGLSVPEDMAVVGHDDAPIAKLLIPRLSTVAVDAAHYGRDLADIVLEAVTGKASSTTSDRVYSLLPREST